MKRSCEILAQSVDGKRAIYIDKQNKSLILAYVNQSARHLKKFRHILEIILGGYKNTDLYDKENINENCRLITVMKFFKGQENDRIYCKEQRADGVYIIIAIELYAKKKSRKITKKEISILEKIAEYEYEIQ